MAISFTDEQLAAIREKDRTLLVSAAAGSGKTATLTQRILARVSDENDPQDISRMLIVTFTRAAAGELRERIGKALTGALAENPRSAHLSRQLLLLPSANIRTIDGFCNEIVRQYSDLLGLPARLRIADTAESEILARSVMEDVMEEGYAGQLHFEGEAITAKEFSFVADTFTNLWHERDLAEILMGLSDKLSGYEEKGMLLCRLAEEMGWGEPFETPWGVYIKSHTEAFLKDAQGQLSIAQETLAAEGGLPFERYSPLAAAELAAVTAALEQKTYGEMRTALRDMKAMKTRLPSVPSSKQTAGGLTYKPVRNRLFTKLEKELAFYHYTSEQFENAAEAYAALHRITGRILGVFDERFGKEKRERGICDYGDLEHMTLNLFYKDGVLTPVAMEQRAAFDEVYIDEYQDVNAVQHKIFEAIASERGRFMVGDIKQSIYGFRGARPDIFASLRRSFPALENAQDSPTANTFFTQNFRSQEPVIRFCNSVFRFLFGAAGESIGYSQKDDLVCGKKGGRDPSPLPKVALFPALGRAERETSEEDVEGAENKERELAFVTGEIHRLLRGEKKQNGEAILPGDIAILLRSRSHLRTYADALEAAGIPVACEENRSFFLNPEILLVISLLNCINNPQRDVYLVAVLCSPLYGFSMEELLLIRAEYGEGSFYRSLCQYREAHPECGKADLFLKDLSRFRTVAEGMPADKLLRMLYRETGISAMTGSEGSARENLLVFYNYARKFEASSFRGLYQFIHYINELIREKRTFAPPERGEAVDAVRLMTVHASKGLQFPVTFLCDVSSTFQRGGAEDGIPFHPLLGVGAYLRDETGVAILNNPMREAVMAANAEADAEEEIRVLYVALTRAEERLYVTGTASRSGAESLMSNAEYLKAYPSRFSVLSAGGVMGWILAGAEAGTYEIPNGSASGAKPAEEESVIPMATDLYTEEKSAGVLQTDDEETVSEKIRMLQERFSYQYPYTEQTRLPGKLSVSRLYPEALDDTVRAVETVDREPAVPRFLGGKDETLAARRGIATHLFMQFCDFESLLREGAARELARLASLKFISKEDASLVSLEEVERFAASPYPKEMLRAEKLYREFRFHTVVAASSLTQNPERRERLKGEKILVQGVIDCMYVLDGDIILMDYKTDRLTKRELASPALAAEVLRRRHGTQIAYYAAAVQKIFGRLPKRGLLYSLHLGQTIEVDVNNYLQIIDNSEVNP